MTIKLEDLPPIPDPVTIDFAYSRYCEVWFDGKINPFVIEASVKGYYIIQYEKDADGNFVFDERRELKTIRRRGVVEVKYNFDKLY